MEVSELGQKSVLIKTISKSQKGSRDIYRKLKRWHRREPWSHSLAVYVAVIG